MKSEIKDERAFAIRALKKQGLPANIAEPGPRETPEAYRARIIANLGGRPPQGPITRHVALQAICTAAGELMAVEERDDSDRKIRRFYGPPAHCWDPLLPKTQKRLTRINIHPNRRYKRVLVKG